MAKSLLIKIAYDGSIFSGMAPQLNYRTIYKAITDALEITRYQGKIWYLSRTDRGVHAVYQVISLRGADVEVVEILNRWLPKGIIAYAFTKIEGERSREYFGSKTYLYVAPYHGEEEEKLQELCQTISNREIDYKALVKSPQKYGNKTVMKLSLKCVFGKRFLFFYVKGKYFLWQQVRRLITFLKAYALGKISDEEVQEILKGRHIKRGIAPAPAEGLILWHVENKLKWKYVLPEETVKRLILEKTKTLSHLFFDKWVI